MPAHAPQDSSLPVPDPSSSARQASNGLGTEPSAELSTELSASVPSRQLAVADSFRTRVRADVTEVRGLALHLARFRQSAIEALSEVEPLLEVFPNPQAPASADSRPNLDSNTVSNALDEFLTEALERIDAAGEGFPRLELWQTSPALGKQAAQEAPGTQAAQQAGSAQPPQQVPSVQLVPGWELSVALRPLPVIRDSIELRTAPLPASLVSPARKGPNIAVYSEIARSLGCEGLLVDADGAVIEGTTTSLVWWDAAGRGFVAASTQRVPSVAEALVAREARSLGAPLMPATVTPDQLVGRDVWAVNALHGIRPVRSIDGQALTVHDAGRLARFRLALDGTWEPVRP
ncbi:branched-subunit amino acid aminotransferase/4-amino-4-deoxychorismate lyase [Leucobacter exalbidus]|uniref:Branched-subunit amino acid aminotransferase/4-amino-4-deoxychorismate lyase n=1 Tax=Leucobacter exalbidus TaxID=662960 RepID=A0A940PP61_9MICO|nr:aminotransferase class IV [Leucobacter exalbidus]MBP1325024.1 branched-subunit amino acid aminotransferase/4-amino-4-deoxychorismate lyase [Leucobacter exalbidus]